MGGVKGVGGAGGAPESGRAGKAKGKAGAFKAVAGRKPSRAASPARPDADGAEGAARPFRISDPEPIRAAEGVQAEMHPEAAEFAEFAEGMVKAADAAAMPGPTTDSDLLPRESVSGLFVRDFVLQGAVALGRPPLGEDEAARIVIEKHIAGTPGLYYDAAVEADGADRFVVKLHRLDSNPPFLPDPNAEATYKIDRRSWQVEEMG